MSSVAPLLIVQMGTPPEAMRRALGDQSSWFIQALGDGAPPVRVVRPYLGEALPAPAAFCAAIVTGSWAMVTDRTPWSERTGAWARDLIAGDKPLLGVCYGHQLMADVMGGVVADDPGGREMGTLPVTLSDQGRADPFFGRLPSVFQADLTHVQSVLVPPAGAQVLASSAHDAFVALRYGSHAISVQFHPEFSARILDECVRRRADKLRAEGFDVPRMRAEIAATPVARQVLTRFVEQYAGVSMAG